MSAASQRAVVLRIVESPAFKRVVVILIVINAFLLGAETFHQLPQPTLDAIYMTNRFILFMFVVELGLRILAHGRAFFRDPWSLFDFVIVAAALIPPPSPLQVLRALRILRALRLISAVPSLRRVVDGLLSAIPGLAGVVVLLLLLLYVAAVMATHFFRDVTPAHFGDLGTSLFTLFQVMTLEGWPDIAHEVMETLPWAWVFFVVYILIATFMVLNLFIGVVVSAIRSRIESEDPAQASIDPVLVREITALRGEIAELRERLPQASNAEEDA